MVSPIWGLITKSSVSHDTYFQRTFGLHWLDGECNFQTIQYSDMSLNTFREKHPYIFSELVCTIRLSDIYFLFKNVPQNMFYSRYHTSRVCKQLLFNITVLFMKCYTSKRKCNFPHPIHQYDFSPKIFSPSNSSTWLSTIECILIMVWFYWKVRFIKTNTYFKMKWNAPKTDRICL